MTNTKDCPLESNNGIRAEFVDEVVAEQLTAEARMNDRARLIAGWKKDQLPKANADNAARLHTRNRKALREAGAIIDEYRAGEGRDAYNAKRRDEYAADKGAPVRDYATGLSDEAKAQRRREQKRIAAQKHRDGMSQADKKADAARRKAKRHEAKELAELEAAAALASRAIT